LREISLSENTYDHFSVPHSFCLAGELQHLLGMGSIIVASEHRINITASETPDPFRIRIMRDGSEAEAAAPEWTDRIKGATETPAEDLDGLTITLEPPEAVASRHPEIAICNPASCVGILLAIKVHRSEERSIPLAKLAREADALLNGLLPGGSALPEKFYSLAMASVSGGALYIGDSPEPLNVQQLLPPESFILAFDPDAECAFGLKQWTRTMIKALQKMGGSEKLLEETQGKPAKVIEAGAGKLNDSEVAVLYGLLRVQQMIRSQLEYIGQAYTDHDRLAEMCDEESEILKDYFEFPSEKLLEIRQQAVESGAIGAKLTYAFGSLPAILLIAPGRRDEVISTLAEKLQPENVFAIDPSPAGIKALTQ
jgi:hypothetical protein